LLGQVAHLQVSVRRHGVEQGVHPGVTVHQFSPPSDAAASWPYRSAFARNCSLQALMGY
jgi:hypothetical protein